MALKDTIKSMKDLLEQISADLPKAENGNKAASQRVRTGTVKLEKTAKKYRKESISSEKGPKGKKKPAAKKAAKKSPAKSAAKSHAKSASKSAAKHHAKPAQKKNQKKGHGKAMKSKRMTSRPSAMMVKRSKMAKRPTAKLARKHAR